jgi:hypothetical protein
MAHPHKIVKCICGNVVSQCRCMVTDKFVEMVKTCEKCEAARLHVETEVEAKERLQKELGLEIINLNTTGIPVDQITKVILGWLVEARYKIEQLEKGEKSIANIVKQVEHKFKIKPN